MIYLYTDQSPETIREALSNIEGLNEAVKVLPVSEVDEEQNHLVVTDLMTASIPWDSSEPPILFERVPFSVNDLIAILLAKLMYEAEALDFCSNETLKYTISCRLQMRDLNHRVVSPSSGDSNYFESHNYAVLTHYAGHLYNGIATDRQYEIALEDAPGGDYAAFTAKNLTTYLMDSGQTAGAEQLLRDHLDKVSSKIAYNYLKLDLINVLMASRLLPYNKEQAEEIKSLISEALPYFEAKKAHWAVATLFMHASEIANYEKSYAESLSYVTKVIDIYDEQGFPEFLASAYLRKGTLLYTWAQDGNPQFYQAAIDTYQKGLQTFTREDAPAIHAEIHHNLAVIYAEMPADEKKKSMWSAFSATSFKESLDFFQKATFPFEYAMVANNYANALLKYPPAKIGDNVEKAIFYYLEALEVRTADQYPVERAHTILNYLEACWQVNNVNKNMEHARYKDMLAKAKEIKSLTDDQQLLNDAQSHLDQIAALGLAIMTE